MRTIFDSIDSGWNFHIFTDHLLLTQFILDCTSFNLPYRVNYSDPKSSEIFKLSRYLCFHINKTRLQKLKELNQ